MTDNYVAETIGRGAFRSWGRLTFPDLDLDVNPFHVKELTANYAVVTLEIYYLDRDGERIVIRDYADGRALTYLREYPVADPVVTDWPKYQEIIAT